MSVARTAARRRREAKADPRYSSMKTGHGARAAKRARQAAKAARLGRSFGFNKK